jgi:RNA polymerase sigma-70 factor (ECF subfamily)
MAVPASTVRADCAARIASAHASAHAHAPAPVLVPVPTPVPSLAAVPAPAHPRSAAPPREALLQGLLHKYPGLVRVLTRRLGQPELALDVLQDAIVTTLAKLDDGVAVSPDVMAAYVFRTAMNHARNHRRNARGAAVAGDREAIEALPDPRPAAADEVQGAANRALVRRVLGSLQTPRDREVLVRFYLDEQDKEEICRELQLSSLQFNQVISRARERARRCLERLGVSARDVVAVLAVLTLVLTGAHA